MSSTPFRFLPKNLSYIFASIAFVITFFSVTSARAQWDTNSDYRYGIALSAGYDAPVGNLSYSFKPAITYGLTGLIYKGNWASSITFGYHAYKPKQDIFYYQVDASNYGTISYRDFTVGSLYLGGAYNLKLSDHLTVSPGVNLGLYYTHFVYNSSDIFIEDSGDLHENDLYLAPKLDFTLSVSENISIGVEGKYNFFAPLGTKTYNDRVGTLYNSYTGNLVLTYNF